MKTRIPLHRGNILTVAGLALAILTLLISFVPCIGTLAVIPGVLAIIFSAFAVKEAAKGNAPKTLTTASLAISIIGVVIAIIWAVFIISVTPRQKPRDLFYPQKKYKNIEENDDSRKSIRIRPSSFVKNMNNY